MSPIAPLKWLAAALIAVVATFVAPPAAHADSNWIAMAISDSSGHVSWIYQGQPAQGAAESLVMTDCRQKASNCRLLASGAGGCLAMVVNAAHSKYFGGWGPTPEDAEAAGLAKAGGGTALKDQEHCLGDT